MQSEINADDFFSMNEEEQEAQAPVPVAEEPAAKPALSADEFFGSIEQEERDASKAILSKDPALANRERIAAQQMETTRLDAATHLDEYEGIANRNATREKLKDAPVFTGYLANNQNNAPILQNDIDGFIDIEKRMAKMAGTDIHHLGDSGYGGIALPENIRVTAMLPLGYAADDAEPAELHNAYRNWDDTITEL